MTLMAPSTDPDDPASAPSIQIGTMLVPPLFQSPALVAPNPDTSPGNVAGLSPVPGMKKQRSTMRRHSGTVSGTDGAGGALTIKKTPSLDAAVNGSFKLSRPTSPNANLNTFISGGFDDLEYGEGEDEDDWEEGGDEEEEEYLQELELVKMEAMAMLRRDNDLNARINNLSTANGELQSKTIALSRDLREMRGTHSSLSREYEQMVADIAKLSDAYEFSQRQNALLRGSVEDGYRHHSSEVDKLLGEKERQDNEKRLRAIRPKRDQETQIACSVCAIRDTLGASDGICGVIQPRPHGMASGRSDGSYDYDADTIPTVHEGLALALEGEVVLTTRPRKLNRDASADRKRRSPSPTSPKIITVSATTQSFRPPRPQSSSDKLFQQRHEESGAMQGGKSAALLNRPQSASPYLHNSQSTGNLAPDQSKFSKMKKMPPKSAGPTSSMAQTAPPQQQQVVQGASSQRTKIMPRNDHVSRTLTNTAAYLQNKIVEDHLRVNSSPMTDLNPSRRAYSAGALHLKASNEGYNNRNQAMSDHWSDDDDDVKRISYN